MEISKFVRFHGYLSSVSLRLQMVYPNTRLSWFTRQLDLELMFTSTISLRTANWIKWEKLFTDLVALSTGSTYSLALFIRFGGFIYCHCLVALFTNSRHDVLIARLQSGHHPSLKQYLHRLDPSEEEQDLVHWLCDCPALLSVRQRVFGCHQGSLEWLATRPRDVVAYARKTLVNLDA